MSQSNIAYTSRDVVFLDLPVDTSISLDRPEDIILRIGRSTLDVGAFCFSRRSPEERIRNRPHLVDLKSFLPGRRAFVVNLIAAISNLLSVRNYRISTVKGYAHSIRTFLNWIDSHDIVDGLSTNDTIEEWLEKFYVHESRLVQFRHKRQNAVNFALQHVVILLQETTRNPRLGESISRKPSEKASSSGTEAATTYDFGRVVALNQALFDGFYDLVINKRPFPYSLDLPASSTSVSGPRWIFPIPAWSAVSEPSEGGYCRMGLAYDVENGRVREASEVVDKVGGRPSLIRQHANALTKRAREKVENANKNERHWSRLRFAVLALNSFTLLFIAHSGVNDAVAREIEIREDINERAMSQKFRSIKYRANGKSISVVIPISFLPTLRRYLEIRKYLLDGKAFPYFLMCVEAKRPQEIRQIDDPWEAHYQVLKRLDPELPMLRGRVLRATVSNFFVRYRDATTAATVLGHSQEVADRNYAQGEVSEHRRDMKTVFTKIAEAAKRQAVETKRRIDAKNHTKSLEEGGQCNRIGHPKPIFDDVPATPTCGAAEGCLFCRERTLIADEEDARKIASCIFLLEKLSKGSGPSEVLNAMIRKCNSDLEKIASVDELATMVEAIKSDVFSCGNLTPFFNAKYQMFRELGMIG